MHFQSHLVPRGRGQVAAGVLAAVIVIAIVVAGCGRSATPIPTATAVPSLTPYPTHTPFPTYTPAPTYTPYPTQTPAPVQVMVITQTPAPTYTLYPTYTPYPTLFIRPTPTPAGPTIYSWQEAGQHIGEDAFVEGTIVRTYNAGSVIFLNFTEEYEGTFTVVIFPDDAGKFPQPPEQMFLNQYVRVRGTIDEYQGAPQIVVNEPAQIEILNP